MSAFKFCLEEGPMFTEKIKAQTEMKSIDKGLNAH